MNRTLFHLDMDAFFASVEQLANPFLRGKPVLVTAVPSARSVVAACSYEARPFGIHSGMPAHQALKCCPHAILVEGNPQKYVHLSTEIFKTLQRFSPLIEPYSIDESFIEIPNLPPDRTNETRIEKLGRQMKQAVRETTGLSCSVGAAPNKLVAKIASDRDKPDGITVVPTEAVDDFLRGLPIGDLWGVGPRLKPVFARLGVSTIGDLRKLDLERLKDLFGVVGQYFYNAARGIDDTPLVSFWEDVAVKSVGHSHTLASNTRDTNLLIALLHALCSKVIKRMETGKVLGRTVNIMIRYGDFTGVTRAASQATPIESESMIYHLAKQLLFENWDGQRNIRLLGISVSNLSFRSSGRQNPLYTDPHDRRMDQAARALRTVQKRYGETSIHYGSSLRLGDRPLVLAHGLGHTGIAGPLRRKERGGAMIPN